MSGKYAAATRVPVSKSREELYRVLARYGAQETLIHERPDGIRVGFILDGIRVAFPMAMPKPEDFTTTAGYERELRRRWRVLILVLKAKFESIAEGAEKLEDAFLPYLMLPDGSLVRDEVVPSVQRAYRSGQMPASLLPGISAKVIELPSRSGGN